ncbi:MAG: chorismate synthase [Oscillospiraceae bacterium]|nr:chorismate synthase [Oscillospiraceae bacterium]
MSSSIGENLRITVFGQSHSPAVGVVMEGLPAGAPVDVERLAAFLARRAPGRNDWSTPRKEADEPEFLSGVKDGVVCGGPVTAILRNTDVRSGDYAAYFHTPRPGHADYTAAVKYGPARDAAGGGHFSGRLTAPLCVAGGICLQLLEREGIAVRAHIASIAGIPDEGDILTGGVGEIFPTLSVEQGEKMRGAIAAARAEGDSVGGVVECAVLGVPAGLGDPLFGGMESRLAAVLLGIPAVKGVEFGAGFGAAALRGSENNDPFALEKGRVVTLTNHAGGILGGITTGMPVRFRVAFKPTPSIAKTQRTVDLVNMEETTIAVGGRHDPCIVPRAVPCVEAAAALAVYDAWLGRKKEL